MRQHDPPDAEPTTGGRRIELTFSVFRQDDNGNRFLVESGLNRTDADRLAAALHARGHKQLYWVEAEETGSCTHPS